MAEDPFETQATEFEPTRHGRYIFRRPLASGGLGVVSIYCDEQLNREVALKEIRSECADDSRHQNNFCAEAEVTGLLEHPGVVPIYSMGTSELGQPYYAMRLITGRELRDDIVRFHQAVKTGQEKYAGPRLRQLLQQLIDVCNVIHYAHSRGVLHRDLKSVNVMLGRYGETLVIDWGLAKPTGESEVNANQQEADQIDRNQAPDPTESERPVSVSGANLRHTQVGSAMGTIAYAPPEQLNGRTDEIDARSDVYSLGAMLYEVLAGEPPQKGMNLTQAIKTIESGEIPSPIEGNSLIPRPLNAIACRAISPAKKNRYQSAKELRNDLQSWLDDEPVTAYPETRLERVYRWKRQHETFVRLATGFLALITVISLFAVYGIDVARKREEQARIREVQAHAATMVAREQEARARVEATHLFKLARQATDNLLTRTSDRLSQVPDATDVREALLQDAVTSYEMMAAVRSDEPDLRRESARIALRLASVQKDLGQTDAAFVSLKSAQTTLESLDTMDDRILLSRVLIDHSRLHTDVQDIDKAQEALSAALLLSERLLEESNSSPESLLIRVQAFIQQGVISFDRSDWLSAAESFATAMRTARQSLDKIHKTDLVRDTRLELARALSNEALARLELMLATKTADKRIADRYADALEQTRWLVSRYPEDTAVIKEYASVLGNYAEHLQLDLNDYTAANDLFKESVDFFSELAAKYPAVPTLRERQILSLTGLGNLAYDQEKADDAIQHHEEAVVLANQLLVQNSVRLSFLRCAAEAKLALGRSLLDAEPKRAEDMLRESLQALPKSENKLEWAERIREDAATSLAKLASD